jgi:hypothetical protein
MLHYTKDLDQPITKDIYLRIYDIILTVMRQEYILAPFYLWLYYTQLYINRILCYKKP